MLRLVEVKMTEDAPQRPSSIGEFAAVTGSSVGILLLLSAYWTLSTYLGAASEFSVLDRRTVFQEILAVVVLEAALIVVIQLLFNKRWLTIILASAFVALNAYCLNLVFDAHFLAMGRRVGAVCLMVGAVIPFTLISAMANSARVRLAVLGIVAILAVSPAITALLLSSRLVSAAPAISEGTPVSFPNIKPVTFVRKPNVYFIGFDAMAPQAVLSEYLKLDDAPLPSMVKSLNFRTFDNLFSEDVPTKNATSNLLALDTDYYFDTVVPSYFNIFSGEAPSPLMELFAENGYETNTVYTDAYFGETQGPHVDHYVHDVEFSVCTHLEGFQLQAAFFGLCVLHSTPEWRAFRGLRKDSSYKTDFAGEFDFMFGYLQTAMERDRPQFFLAHVHPPQHTEKIFQTTPEQIAGFKDDYVKTSTEAAENLRRLTTYIAERDPTGILFVYGDHGTWISRTIDFQDDPKFFVQDRYGVLGAIYPATACKETFDGQTSKFLTTPQVARQIVTCLAGGEDPFIAPYDYRLRNENARYEDFLYD